MINLDSFVQSALQYLYYISIKISLIVEISKIRTYLLIKMHDIKIHMQKRVFDLRVTIWSLDESRSKDASNKNMFQIKIQSERKNVKIK